MNRGSDPRRTADLLLVEDNPGDVELVREALAMGGGAHRLWVVRDGVEAADFLLRRPPFEGRPRPDLVLLDLNLPRKDGRELLAEIKQHHALKAIPVVVWTTSADEADVRRCYELHANCFVTKPADLERLIEALAWVQRFWLSLASLPNEPPGRCFALAEGNWPPAGQC